MGRKILVLLLLVALSFVGGSLFLDFKWKEIKELDHETTIEIPKGFSAIKTGLLLEENGIINSSKYFKYYLKLNDLGAKLKSGVYVFEGPLNIQDVTAVLVKGKTASKKLTIVEGRASWEIFGVLKKTFPDLDSLKWTELVYDKEWAKKLNVPADNLEGYLFPNTYNFPLKANEAIIQEIMVHQFHKVMAELTVENSEVFHKYGLGGTVTLASVVEEESAVPHERVRVAGVFYNRLKRGMPLGADPTVRFIFRNLTGPIYRSQLNSDNPYNTRKFKGLPPGPISNPGKDALRAALFPATHKELYFVGKDDGSREHFFTKNLKDHNKYKNIAAKNRGE